MKAILLTLAMMTQCTPAPAIELVSGVVVLDAQEMANMPRCAREGGCRIVSMAGLAEYQQKLEAYYENIAVIAAQQMVADAKAEMVCKRDSI